MVMKWRWREVRKILERGPVLALGPLLRARGPSPTPATVSAEKRMLIDGEENPPGARRRTWGLWWSERSQARHTAHCFSALRAARPAKRALCLRSWLV